MLVLSRKPGEKVVLDNITVTVLEVKGNRIRLGFDAPESVDIIRGELADWKEPRPTTATPDTHNQPVHVVAAEAPRIRSR
jgi:carbon storage regulator